MKLSKILMVTGSILILALFFLPIWNITLEAPQYPIPLGMDIYIYDFADSNPYDIKNINLMNHYVGMQYIPETIPEFKIFPLVIGIMSGIGLLIGVFFRPKWYLFWFITMSTLALVGIYDFYLWEHDYGHNLDPKAIMKFTNPDGTVMGFQPPLFGSKDILNFRAHSYPQLGVAFLTLGMAASLIAYFMAKKENKTDMFTNNSNSSKLPVMGLVGISLILFACEAKINPINYGSDNCTYCQMTIVDKTHAAEIVTKKGKVFKFDAIECMVYNLNELDTTQIKYYLTIDYLNPEEFTDAKTATYLISNNISSPMGANLSAFDNIQDASKIKEENGGQLYTWEEITRKLSKKKSHN